MLKEIGQFHGYINLAEIAIVMDSALATEDSAAINLAMNRFHGICREISVLAEHDLALNRGVET